MSSLQTYLYLGLMAEHMAAHKEIINKPLLYQMIVTMQH